MNPQRAVFLSDLHIRDAADPPARQLLAFLDTLPSDVLVVLLGDVFDWWYGLPGHVPAALVPVVERLEGRSLLWVEGNHDMQIARAVGDRIEVRVGPQRLRVGGIAIDARHGDLLEQDNLGYRALRGFLRSPVMSVACGLLGPSLTQRIGYAATGAKHRAEGGLGQDGRKQAWLDAARLHAQARRAEGVDLAVVGHGHWLGWWPEGLVCLGDWLHWCSYLQVDADGPRLMQFVEGASVVVAARPEGAIGR